MPNWCFTQMIFHGEKEEITDFHSKIEAWTPKNYKFKSEDSYLRVYKYNRVDSLVA